MTTSPSGSDSAKGAKGRTSELGLLLILSALMAFTSLSIDIYLPAMPAMQRELHGNVELTLTSFLLGFAIAQLFWGPISDRIGRRRPLVVGVVLFVVGSAGCALSQTLGQIVFWRMFQAFGACTGPMLARTMVRDLYARTHAARMLSTLTVTMAVAPIAGPLIGGQIVRWGSWHGIFWLLAVLAAAMLLVLRRLPETLPGAMRATTPAHAALGDYRKLLGNAAFMRYVLCVTSYYVSLYAFLAASPRVYIEHFHVAPENYGWLFGLNIVGVTSISLVNRRLVGRFSLDTLLRAAAMIAAAAMLLCIVLSELHIGGLVGVVVPVFVFFSMNGIVAATATAAALDGVESRLAGSATALIGSLQYGSGIISSLLVAAFSDGTPRTLVVTMAVFALGAAVMAAWSASANRKGAARP